MTQLFQTAFSGGSPFTFSTEFIERVIRAYRLAAEQYEQPQESMWHEIKDKWRQDVHATLVRGEPDEVATLLGDPARHDLQQGIDAVSRWWINAINEKILPEFYVLPKLTELPSLIGARRMWNQEAPKAEWKNPDPETALRELDAFFGISVPVPNPFPGEFGIVTARGIVSLRMPWALHHASRILQTSRIFGGNKVVEIGGGLGRVAFYANVLGIRDYTIVDIPLTMVAQAAFLGATLGPDALWFYGEPEDRQHGRIRLCPPHWLLSANEKFSVALNTDSLTEMTPQQAMEYISHLSRHCSVLVSVNHEANDYTTPDFARMLGFGFPTIRSPFGLRPGYVEEIFFFNPDVTPKVEQIPQYDPMRSRIFRPRSKTAHHLAKLLLFRKRVR